MITFILGMVILVVGGFFYGLLVEKVFAPQKDRTTPAVALADGVDYVAMPKWKNMLIELLNIAGTGPVLGPIQGILFGPIAFITIPIGCVIAGATHDYFVGMISMRNKGAQMPGMVKKYLGNGTHTVYLVIMMILMVLTGVVFIYTPGDLIVKDILGMDNSASSSAIWIAYGLIFLYYLAATFFPIDKIIGQVYPVFGGILVISAVGVFLGVLLTGGKYMPELSLATMPNHPLGQKFIPVFFITVACGIMSGFHGSQATLISRTVKDEKEGRTTFYNMMLLEGFIAMAWAAGSLVLIYKSGKNVENVMNLTGDGKFLYNATNMVGAISRNFLGKVGGILAVLGVIILPITSGDTAFRAVRLMLAERLNMSQKEYSNRLKLTLAIFIPAIAILVFAKINANGFNLLWRYFGFTNQLVAVFALAMATVYLNTHKKNYIIPLVPFVFYTFIVAAYILNAKIGFGLESHFLNDPNSYVISYPIAAVITLVTTALLLFYMRKNASRILQLEEMDN